MREDGFWCHFADYVPTVRPTACLAPGFREKCCAGRLGDPVSMCFVVMCLVASALSLPLWPHCVVEGNNKADSTEALPKACRHSTHKFLPCLSPSRFQLGTRTVMETWHGDISQRGVVSAFKMAAFSSLLIAWAQISFLKNEMEKFVSKVLLQKPTEAWRICLFVTDTYCHYKINWHSTEKFPIPTWTHCQLFFKVCRPPAWEKLCAVTLSDGQDGSRVFLKSLLEIQLCGNTGLVKYRLMACES